MTLLITPANAQEAPAPAGHAAAPADAGHGAATTTEVGHDSAGHSGVFPPFDSSTFPSQILWLVITFALFYRVVATIAAPRISAILEVRHDRIAGDLEEAERMRGETDAAVAAYEQSLAEARTKAGAIAGETRDRVAKDLDARRVVIEAELAAKLTVAEARIAEIKAEAMGEVNTIAAETAEAIVSALIGQGNHDEAAAAVSAIRGA